MIVPITWGEVFIEAVIGAFVKLCSPGVRKLKLHKTTLKNQSFWYYRLEKSVKIEHWVGLAQASLHVWFGHGAIVGLVVKSASPMVDIFRLVIDNIL